MQVGSEIDIPGVVGEINPKIPGYLNTKWARRALTLELKAQDLLNDMLGRVGPDDPLTDHADAIVDSAQSIGDLLTRAKALRSTPKDPHP